VRSGVVLLQSERRMAGRQPFTSTDAQRRSVKTVAGYGVPQDDVARKRQGVA